MSEAYRCAAGTWQSVLEVASVHSGDNFLDMGGNSLKAGEITWRVRDELSIEVPIDVVLDTETFAQLVDIVATTPANGSPQAS